MARRSSAQAKTKCRNTGMCSILPYVLKEFESRLKREPLAEGHAAVLKLVRGLRRRASSAPEEAAFWFGNGGMLMAMLTHSEYPGFREIFCREQLRRSRAGRKPDIDPAHIEELRQRALRASELNPKLTRKEVLEANCDWYLQTYGGEVSPRTMAKELGTNSIPARSRKQS